MAATLMTTTSATTAEAAPPPGKGKPTPTPTPTPTSTPTQGPVNPADSEFVSMMIPHHYQALIMSRMAPGRSNDPNLLALAGQIEVEQDLEIAMMQGWQSENGLEVTDAEMAYHHLIMHHPQHAAEMGMATPAELAALGEAQGNTFDVLYLQLMIRHHGGALDMIVHVLMHGSDETLAQWANDMYVTQQAQINWMQAMLADKS
jgi:uncharacterized protein (DUF305 family)